MTTLIVPTDFPTIQSAVMAASPGDVILIQEGIYSESVIVNKNDITIKAIDNELVEIDGLTKEGIGIDISGAKGILLQDLRISNFSIGVFLRGNKNSIVNVRCLSNGIYGILLRGSKNKIQECVFAANNVSGINMFGSDNTIKNNILEFNAEAGIINVGGKACENLIENNSITSSTVAIGWYSSDSTENIFKKNLLNENEVGFILYGKSNKVQQNILIGNTKTGIIVDNDCNSLMNNDISSSLDGIIIQGTNTTIIGNIIQENTQGGINVLSDNNLLQRNIINSNNIGVAVTGNLNSINNNVISANELFNIINKGIDNEIFSNVNDGKVVGI